MVGEVIGIDAMDDQILAAASDPTRVTLAIDHLQKRVITAVDSMLAYIHCRSDLVATGVEFQSISRFVLP